MLTLLNETAELGLDLLEKNNVLLPFCRVRTPQQSITIITPDDGQDAEDYMERAVDSVRVEFRRQVAAGTVAEFAFCSDIWAKTRDNATERRFLKIEFQNGTPESAIYFFPITVENGKAQIVSKYILGALREKLL